MKGTPVSELVKFIPGLAGATVAYIALKFFGLVGLDSVVLEFVVFVAIYLVLAVLVDQAMRRYGTSR